MNINTGSITCTAAAYTVTGTNVATAWANVHQGDSIIISDKHYVISTIDAPNETLTVERALEDTVASASYTIITDFTRSLSLPLMNKGDVGTAQTYSRAMHIIDSAIAAMEAATPTAASATTYNVTAVAHGFAVGSVVRYDGAAWQYAQADSREHCFNYGIITAKTNDTFTITTTGLATVSTASWTPGKTYVLTNVGGVLKESSSAVYITDYVILCPVIIALSATTGIVISSAVTEPAEFSSASAGLVPAFSPGSSSILSTSGWIDPTAAAVADDSLVAGKLKYSGYASPVTYWNTYWPSVTLAASTVPAMNAMMALKSGIDTWAHNKFDAKRFRYEDGATGSPPRYSKTVAIKANHYYRFRIWGNGGYQSGTSGAYQGGAYAEVILTSLADQDIIVAIGGTNDWVRITRGGGIWFEIRKGYYGGSLNTTGLINSVGASANVLVNEISDYITTATPSVIKTGKVVIECIDRDTDLESITL